MGCFNNCQKAQGCCSQEKESRCLCHRRPVHHHRPRQQKLIKDCICSEWSVPPGEEQTIFQSSGHRQILASGFVSVNSSSIENGYATVRFFLDGVEVAGPLNVFHESSVAFSLTRFDQITVECPEGLEIDQISEVCEGEIGLNVRIPL